jgi:Rod binding domain-containing protein
MASSFALPAPGLKAADLLTAKNGVKNGVTPQSIDKADAAGHAKAKASAQDFESVFLNSMFQHMFSGVTGEGPMGGNGATGTWRSFLTEQYAKSVTKAGGIGIADQVYKSLIAHQEARP